MPSDDLYQPCHWCDHPDIPRLPDGTCPGCGGAKFFKIGLTLGQVDQFIEEAHRFYLPDGTFERMLSPRHVIERRKEAAREIERLRAENARLTRLNDDKFAHLQGYCKAADEDLATIARLRAAVQAHHDQKGDDRCHLDDLKLYRDVLGEGIDPYVGALPPDADMLESCRRYIRRRRCPGPEGVAPLPGDMTIAQLTAEVARLRAALATVREMAEADIARGRAPLLSALYQIEADARAALGPVKEAPSHA